MSITKRSIVLAGNLAIISLVLQAFVTVVFAQPKKKLISSYTFVSVDIPTADGQFEFTSLADINNKGEITGGFTNGELGPYGFVLNGKLKSTEIRCSKDVLETDPQSINKRGEIAGIALILTDRIPIPEPPFEIIITKLSGFFRNKKGKCTILDFPGATLTEPTGVNDDGQIVGDYSDATGKFHGFVWDNGVFLTLDVPFPTARLSAPTGINNLGQIVGFYFDDNTTEPFPNGRAHGFLYTNGIFTSFDFPDAVVTVPLDINDNGQIVGTFAADGDTVARSFVLDRGIFTALDVPFPGVVATQVSGINDRGQIVGRYIANNLGDAEQFLSHGFIATPTKSRSVASLSASGAGK